MRRAYHCRQIAAELAWIADIQGQQVEQIVPQPAAFVELDRRNAQSLLPDLGRSRIVAAMRGPADIALMRRVVGGEMGVKASGGVRDLKQAQEMIQAGATRIGASVGVKIVQEIVGMQQPANGHTTQSY